MEKVRKITKVIISWIETMPDGNPVIQTRKYNNKEKAEAFADKLFERNIKNYTVKTTEVISIQ